MEKEGAAEDAPDIVTVEVNNSTGENVISIEDNTSTTNLGTRRLTTTSVPENVNLLSAEFVAKYRL